MSYILDALRKLERERQPPAAAGESAVAAGPAAPRRSLTWPLIGGGALLVNVVLVSLLLWPARAPKPPVAKETAPAQTKELPSAQTSVAAVASPPAVVSPAPVASPPTPTASMPPSSVAVAAAPAPGPVVARNAPASVEPLAGPPRPAQKLERPRPPGRRDVAAVAPPAGQQETAPPARTPAAVTPPSAAVNPAEQKAPALPTVASGVPAGVPRLKLEVLVYSDSPPDRFVFINGRKYKEGERVDEAVVLERIQQDGAVLSYEGRQFVLRE